MLRMIYVKPLHKIKSSILSADYNNWGNNNLVFDVEGHEAYCFFPSVILSRNKTVLSHITQDCYGTYLKQLTDLIKQRKWLN